MIQLHCWRRHLPTNSVFIFLFNESQVADLHHMPIGMAEKACKAVVAKWNRDPRNTDFVYEYIGVRNAEVQQWEQEQACQSTSR